MLSVSVRVETLVDEVRRALWSREPHRYLQLGVIVSNDGDEYADRVSYELLLPEELLFDFDADGWKPSHRHLINGKSYAVWSTRNVLNSKSGQGYGIRAGSHLREKLAVDLKPYASSMELLWRAFEGKDEFPPEAFGRQEVPLKLYAPSL